MTINPDTKALIASIIASHAILQARIETVYWNGYRDGAAHVAAELPKQEGA